MRSTAPGTSPSTPEAAPRATLGPIGAAGGTDVGPASGPQSVLFGKPEGCGDAVACQVVAAHDLAADAFHLTSRARCRRQGWTGVLPGQRGRGEPDGEDDAERGRERGCMPRRATDVVVPECDWSHVQ